MKNFPIICIGFLVVLISLCACTSKPFSAETEIFKNYLHENFNCEIEPDIHYYFLSGSYACKGCISRYLTIIDSLLPKSNKNITLITTLDLKVLATLREKMNILQDTKGNLNYENLNLNNLTLFTTKSGEIIDISYYTVNDETLLRKKMMGILNPDSSIKQK